MKTQDPKALTASQTKALVAEKAVATHHRQVLYVTLAAAAMAHPELNLSSTFDGDVNAYGRAVHHESRVRRDLKRPAMLELGESVLAALKTTKKGS